MNQKEKGRVFLFDDDADSLQSVVAALRRDGFDVFPFADPREGLARVEAEGGDVVVTDLRMPGLTGLEVLRHVTKKIPDVPVVILTAYGTVEGAIEAVRAGASDFLLKPVEIPRLRAAVFKALKERGMRREIERLREEAGRPLGIEGIVGSSRAMEEVLRKIRLVAPTRMNVLITGESGTGKELVARGVHGLSPRADRPFLPLNCAAIPETLLESELFGHEKGAFTGATASRPGKFENAEGGTLFLDEVGDVSPAIQSKLLRAIEQKEVTRVGGSQVIHADVRIIAATNADLEKMVAGGTFREDLFYRINVIPVFLPPLRDRKEDILPLTEHFLVRFNREHGKSVAFSKDALDLLLEYRWTGNVRELENLVERAVVMAKAPVVRAQDLPRAIRVAASLPATGSYGQPPAPQASIAASAAEPPHPAAPREGRPRGEYLKAMEREELQTALSSAGWVIARAAKILGWTPRQVAYKMKKHGLSSPWKK